jgi:DNA-binding XRE family transcriptional regulator
MSLGLTQRQAAQLFGLTPEGYNRIEMGKRDSVPAYVDSILTACQISETVFLALKDRRGVVSG